MEDLAKADNKLRQRMAATQKDIERIIAHTTKIAEKTNTSEDIVMKRSECLSALIDLMNIMSEQRRTIESTFENLRALKGSL
jgi:hypothetical protein